MISSMYRSQVDLLIQTLPFVSKEKIFALKGGTAINLFVREMPRLSVDIDLTYLPIDSREVALKNIEEALTRIKSDLEKNIPGITIHPVSLREGTDIKLNCQYKNAQIKIEVNTITRGNVFPVRLMQIVDSVQDEFGKFAAIDVISEAELFGGKICAAIDRQHPRDLFDVKLLLGNEGLNKNIWQGFIVGLISHYKPISELLSPILKDQKSAFETQFAGMSKSDFSYKDYESTRKLLIEAINHKLSETEKMFLLSFESGEPEWSLFSIEIIQKLPAVKWKLINIQKLKNQNPDKHKKKMKALSEILNT